MRPEVCRHTIGGAERCRHCNWLTCPTCHRAPDHIKHCPETKRIEMRR